MKDVKFRAKSREHNIAFQKRMFELGVEWSHSGKNLVHINEPYLYIEKGHIACGETLSIFNESTYPEITLDDLYSPEFLNPETDKFKEVLPQIEKLKGSFGEIKNQMDEFFGYLDTILTDYKR
jgi:hypothetical protein